MNLPTSKFLPLGFLFLSLMFHGFVAVQLRQTSAPTPRTTMSVELETTPTSPTIAPPKPESLPPPVAQPPEPEPKVEAEPKSPPKPKKMPAKQPPTPAEPVEPSVPGSSDSGEEPAQTGKIEPIAPTEPPVENVQETVTIPAVPTIGEEMVFHDVFIDGPPGQTVALILHFSHIAEPRWLSRIEAILRPMPDYGSLIADRGNLSDWITTLFVSSNNPRSVVATQLGGQLRADKDLAQFFDFVAKSPAPVAFAQLSGRWVGTRQSEFRGDERLFVIPEFAETELKETKFAETKPVTADAGPRDSESSNGEAARSEAEEVAKSRPSNGAATWFWLVHRARLAGYDSAANASAARPAWMNQFVQSVKQVSKPVIAQISLRGLPHPWQLPEVGTLHHVKSLNAQLSFHQDGFLVQGEINFADPASANQAKLDLEKTQKRLTSSALSQALLHSFHVYNLVNGLVMVTRDKHLWFNSTVSAFDAMALMTLSADWSRRFYSSLELPAPSSTPAPSPSSSPAPSPSSSPVPSPSSSPAASPGPGAPK